MQKLAEICVRRPVFATMLILSLTVVGLFSYRSLGVDLFPKIDLPTITVTVVNPGASPQEIETEITDKVEGAVNTISGIDELRSTSVEGVSQVFITFLLEKNPDIAAQEVRNKIDLIGQFADHFGVMVGDHAGTHQRKPELARAEGIAHSWRSSTPLIRNWIPGHCGSCTVTRPTH